MSRRKLLFLATEDWFIRSHFLPMVQEAVAQGYETVVAARRSDAAKAIEALGARVEPLEAGRGSIGPGALVRGLSSVRTLLAQEAPDVIHAIALRPCLLAAIAAPKTPMVLAITGLGHLGVAEDLRSQMIRRAALSAIAVRVRGGAVLLTENIEDALAVSRAGAGEAVRRGLVAPGAGIDPADHPALPEPTSGPFTVGLAARIIRSKGVHVLIEAVDRMILAGLNVRAVIAGEPDPENPGRYVSFEMQSWRERPHVALRGKVADMAGFWRETHLATLPSLGGEGLPRSLLEAAAFGRAIVTTDTPGCRDLVRHEIDGLITPPGDSEQLAAALIVMMQNPARRAACAAAARARALGEFTVTEARTIAAAAWRRALGDDDAELARGT